MSITGEPFGIVLNHEDRPGFPMGIRFMRGSRLGTRVSSQRQLRIQYCVPIAVRRTAGIVIPRLLGRFPKSSSQQTRRWRATDSNPRSPGRERRSRFGEREPGKGHGDDKRLSRHGEYLKRDRTALLELLHPCGSALRGDADMRRRRPETEIVGDANERGQIGKISAAHC